MARDRSLTGEPGRYGEPPELIDFIEHRDRDGGDDDDDDD